MPAIDRTWVDFLSALLTPTIAFLAAYIAFQQYRINKLRLQHELYERRLSVYRAVQAFLSEIFRNGCIGDDLRSKFYADASEATFLFDKPVQEYIDDLFKKAIDLLNLKEQLDPPNGSDGLPTGDERTRVAREKYDLLSWFHDQFGVSKELFRKYMGIK